MKAIVWCEKSQMVARALCEVGIDACSCDILPCEHPEWGIPHIQDNALNHLTGYDLGIGHPDCTYIANSGVRWIIGNQERYAQMVKACEFFMKLWRAEIEYIGLENPIPHKYAREFLPPYSELIQPWWFGDGETKATCLWLKHLPPLMATVVNPERYQRVHLEPPSPDRKANRSRTYQGLADAMADQWGKYLMQAVMALYNAKSSPLEGGRI